MKRKLDNSGRCVYIHQEREKNKSKKEPTNSCDFSLSCSFSFASKNTY